MSKPNPGSNEAVRAGCTCPEHDNHYGKGMPGIHDQINFYVEANCPLHGTEAVKKEKEQ